MVIDGDVQGFVSTVHYVMQVAESAGIIFVKDYLERVSLVSCFHFNEILPSWLVFKTVPGEIYLSWTSRKVTTSR
jgi:hypothetical protein